MKRFSLVVAAGLAMGCGPKESPNAAVAQAIVGWHQAEGMLGPCYYPPDFEKLEQETGLTARKQARGDALDAMLAQWSGQKDESISFAPNDVMDAETVLLGRADRIEDVVKKNLSYCETAMDPTSTTSGWEGWVKRLPSELTAGECLNPIRDRLFHYLELGQAWYWQGPICSGNEVEIRATSNDRYRISEDGDWINVNGEEDSSTVLDSSFPCNETGCVAGQLVGKFEGAAGYVEIFPIGVQTVFKAPMDGTLSVGVNDTTFYDNTWYKSGGVIDHAGIEIGPILD